MLFGSLLKFNGGLHSDKLTVSLPGYKFQCLRFWPQEFQRQQSRAKDPNEVIQYEPDLNSGLSPD